MMKRFRILFVFALAIVAFGTLLVSCGSDDDKQEPNTITNNKGTYKITSAYIMDLTGQYSITLTAHPGVMALRRPFLKPILANGLTLASQAAGR